MAVTGVADGEMRSRLFRDQNRQLVGDTVISCHPVCRRVRADRKLTHRQRLMVHQHIVPDILFILRSIRKIGAGIIRDHAVLKVNLQILIVQLTQINLADEQLSFRSLKHRRRKDLPHPEYLHPPHSSRMPSPSPGRKDFGF